MVRWTTVVGLFTVILAAVALFQFWAFVQSERAEVAVSDIRLANELTSASNGRLIIELVNPSKTTARIEEFRLYGDGGMTIPDQAKPQLVPRMRPTVAPGVPIHVEMDIPEKFPPEYIDGVNKGEYHIWVIGSIRYADSFGWLGGGETGFCFYYDPSRGRGVDSFYRCHDPRYEY